MIKMISARIDFGDTLEDKKMSTEYILENARSNQFLIFDKIQNNVEIKQLAEELFAVYITNFPVEFDAKLNNFPIKIVIQRKEGEGSFLFVHPLQPHKMKKEFDDDHEYIDMG